MEYLIVAGFALGLIFLFFTFYGIGVREGRQTCKACESRNQHELKQYDYERTLERIRNDLKLNRGKK